MIYIHIYMYIYYIYIIYIIYIYYYLNKKPRKSHEGFWLRGAKSQSQGSVNITSKVRILRLNFCSSRWGYWNFFRSCFLLCVVVVCIYNIYIYIYILYIYYIYIYIYIGGHNLKKSHFREPFFQYIGSPDPPIDFWLGLFGTNVLPWSCFPCHLSKIIGVSYQNLDLEGVGRATPGKKAIFEIFQAINAPHDTT